jgi:hypothetical protein
LYFQCLSHILAPGAAMLLGGRADIRADAIAAMNSPEQKRALICGVNGQDGAYLSKLLLRKGYKLFGTSRDAQASSFQSLQALGIDEAIDKLSMAPAGFRSVIDVVSSSDPHEIYYLAGQSSVGLSFDQPAETIGSITLGTLNISRPCGSRTNRPGSTMPAPASALGTSATKRPMRAFRSSRAVPTASRRPPHTGSP